MWHNATSGFTLSIYLFVLLLTVLASDKAEARRGCSIFGHSCYGGHGKRSDPLARRTLEAGDNLPGRHPQESEMSSPNDDDDDDLLFVLPSDKLREHSFVPSRPDTRPFNSYRLSSLVDQWLATHRRPHRTDLEVTNK